MPLLHVLYGRGRTFWEWLKFTAWYSQRLSFITTLRWCKAWIFAVDLCGSSWRTIFWVTSWLIPAGSMLGVSQNLCFFCLSTSLLRSDHKIFCSPRHLVITLASWQGAPSCLERPWSLPNSSWTAGRSCSLRMFWFHLSWLRSKPTHECSRGCFTVGRT